VHVVSLLRLNAGRTPVICEALLLWLEGLFLRTFPSFLLSNSAAFF
jgi:hypothetical protein